MKHHLWNDAQSRRGEHSPTRSSELLRTPTAALLALCLLSVASCSTVQRDVVRVWVNRTETPIEEQEAVIPACSTLSMTQADIDRGLELRHLGHQPSPPQGSVDLTTTAVSPDPSNPKPIFIVILADGATKYYFGNMNASELPTCSGRAALPSFPGG